MFYIAAAWRKSNSKRALHNPVGMYEDESMASLKEKLEEQKRCVCLNVCVYVHECVCALARE